MHEVRNRQVKHAQTERRKNDFAFVALGQTDFKRMVAYSSVSHMGYVLLGFAVWASGSGPGNVIAVNGAMFQMIAHGISSAGMFFLVGVIYDRAHHRQIAGFGGLGLQMPVYTSVFSLALFAALGLPGEEVTVAEVLKQQGYHTVHIGKWHLGDQPEFLPTRHGFDSYYGLPYSNDMGRQSGREPMPPLPPRMK